MKSLKYFWITVSILIGSVFCFSGNVLAEEENDETAEIIKAATSISISPVNKVLKLEASKVYEDSFTVTNNGENEMEFEVYASPYSYTYSEEEGEYKLGFSKENSFTQIVRWVTFKDKSGNYVKNPHFKAGPNESVKVTYRVTTPSDIPGGGQYAVLFAHTLSSSTTSSGIKTEASPGLVLYGRASGEATLESEVKDLKIGQGLKIDEEEQTIINGYARVKNNGNVDFMAYGKLKVEGIFGITYYETPSNQGLVSIIPEVELSVTDKWEETPYFGIFKVTWTVSATDKTETISKIVMLLPAPIIITIILLLTILTIWIIITVRRRKERRSRLTV